MWAGVAIGGALGALARYGLGLWVGGLAARHAWLGFPYATLGINVVGSFLLGLTLACFGRGTISEAWRVWFGTGFLGAFTTFSTFSTELDGLALRGEGGKSALYALLSLGLGLGAAVAGRLVGSR